MENWDDLRFFLAVAREGSLSRAALALRVTQPTVGRRIAAFEKALGARLFVASATGQALSATGQRLLEHATRMEASALAAERAGAGRDVGLRGTVTITASEWLVQTVLSSLVAPLSSKYPELEIELLADVRHLNLARREADIALRPSRFERDDVVQRVVARVAFGLYASDGYLGERGAPDFARQCEGHQLIVMSESLGKIPDVAWLPSIAARARVVARTNGREPMVSMAIAGVGIACLPCFLGDGTPGLRLLETPPARPERQLWLGAHRDARGTPRVKACLSFLAERLERLGGALCPREVAR